MSSTWQMQGNDQLLGSDSRLKGSFFLIMDMDMDCCCDDSVSTMFLFIDDRPVLLPDASLATM